jgi:DNA repair protein RadC
LLLNRANNTTGYAKISQGGITGTVVDIQLIAKYAIESLSKGIIMAHNHPSGVIRPSEQDKLFTNQTKKALALFEIQVLDHIILGADNYYSFVDKGIL